MKRKILLGLLMISAISLVGCGKNQKEQVSEYYQEQYGLDEEAADEMADMYLEINGLDESSDASEGGSTEAVKEINSCFDDVLETMPFLDRNYAFMTEEELVAAYGTPSQKLQNGSLVWTFEDGAYSATVMVKEDINLYSVKRDEDKYAALYDYYQYEDIEGEYCPDFSVIESWFDGYNFTNAYDYSTLNTYDDFCEKFGSKGLLSEVRAAGFNGGGSIMVLWRFIDNDGVGRTLTLGFDSVTGELNSDNGGDPVLSTMQKVTN